MKTVAIVCILFSLLGCKQNADKNAIYGSWTTIKERKYTAEEILDSTVFYKKNSLTNYHVMGGKIVDSLNATFRINNNESIVKAGNSTFIIEIEELNNQNLVIRQKTKKTSVTYYRLK